MFSTAPWRAPPNPVLRAQHRDRPRVSAIFAARQRRSPAMISCARPRWGAPGSAASGPACGWTPPAPQRPLVIFVAADTGALELSSGRVAWRSEIGGRRTPGRAAVQPPSQSLQLHDAVAAQARCAPGLRRRVRVGLGALAVAVELTAARRSSAPRRAARCAVSPWYRPCRTKWLLQLSGTCCARCCAGRTWCAAASMFELRVRLWRTFLIC